MANPTVIEGIKKAFMKHVWRITQCQVIIGLIVWSFTLAGIFYPYVEWRLRELFGITNVTVGMLLLFLLVLSAILGFGAVYDVVLKMWRPQQIVATERNPYAIERQTAKEIINWQYFNLPQLKAQIRILENIGRAEDKPLINELKKICDYINNWNSYNVLTDRQLRVDIREILKLISKPQPKTFEEALREEDH